jgi:hypothetical protein
MDGIGALRAGTGDAQPSVIAAAATVNILGRTPTTDLVHTVADRLAALEGPHAFDQLLNSVTASKAVRRERLAELGRWLCSNGVNRQQVKAGLALLGVSGDAEDTELVTQLGRLEELTLYALVALSNLLEGQAEQAIFTLAQQVDGWGRIHAVQRLAKTTDPTIRQWLLRGGFANDVMDEEIAFVAAMAGGLREALEHDADDELLDWAGRLLVALAMGGPAKDMSDYADGASAIHLYLKRMSTAEPSLKRLQHLFDLERYLTGWATSNPHLDSEARGRLASTVTTILDRPDWSALVGAGLEAHEVTAVKDVLRLARRFGYEPSPVIQAWLRREPHDSYLWQTILVDANESVVVAQLVALGSEVLPFSAVKTGPAKDLGLGPDYRVEACLEQILQRLQKFPGVGWEAIEVGLDCRVTRTRNVALRALAE